MILLWTSRAWSTLDKVIGTVVIPGGLATVASLSVRYLMREVDGPCPPGRIRARVQGRRRRARIPRPGGTRSDVNRHGDLPRETRRPQPTQPNRAGAPSELTRPRSTSHKFAVVHGKRGQRKWCFSTEGSISTKAHASRSRSSRAEQLRSAYAEGERPGWLACALEADGPAVGARAPARVADVAQRRTDEDR